MHGLTPVHTGEHTIVGPVVGLVLLLTSIASIVGFRSRSACGRLLLGWTGIVVAVGFVLYHALPISGPATNPYFGKSVPRCRLGQRRAGDRRRALGGLREQGAPPDDQDLIAAEHLMISNVPGVPFPTCELMISEQSI